MMGGEGSTNPEFLAWLRALTIGVPVTPPGGGAPDIVVCRESPDVFVAKVVEK